MADLFRPTPTLTGARMTALRLAAQGPLFRVKNGYRPRGGSLIRLDTVRPLLSAGLLCHGSGGAWASAVITPEGRALIEGKRQRKAA